MPTTLTAAVRGAPLRPVADRPAATPPLPVDLLADIAGGLARVTTLWRPLVRHDPDHRDPIRLFVTDRYEVWVIGWSASQHTRLHDHGSSTGAMAVTAGTIREVLFHRGRFLELALATGRTRTFPVGTVHDIVNPGPEPATTIHVYSPPLETMSYYDPVSLHPTETVRVPYEEPKLPRHGGPFLHHPANRG